VPPTPPRKRAPSESAGLKRFDAVVRGEGQPHPDGSERLYIAVNKTEAVGFPYKENERVPVKFEVNGKVYDAGVRTTPAQPIVYVASDLLAPGGGKVTLASVLADAAVQKGQRVTLEAGGPTVRLSKLADAAVSRRFPRSLPVNNAVLEARLAVEVQSVLSRLEDADGPAAIVIGHSRRPPRVQVFTGSCTEGDVAAIRQILKAHDPQYQASIVRDPSQYRQYRTATVENPTGAI
jgi:hypothetical protein